MSDITPRSESVLDIVKAVKRKSSLLPEFQRDFRWELNRTYDLFDSLVRDIFIGTIIYGKPSFAISCRELDVRPRRGKGRRAKLEITHLDEAEARVRSNSDNFRVILDGQQRITAIYRAVVGVDSVYLVLKNEPVSSDLEDMMDYFSGTERDDRVCVKLKDAYEYETESTREKIMIERFEQSRYAKVNRNTWDKGLFNKKIEHYLNGCTQLRKLFNREKLVSYYLLDMGLDKFCLFFERSNSRGIQLNFTDILAAKLYSGFNLRGEVEKFESNNPDITLNRELIIRAISYLASDGRDIDKSYILKHLLPEHFNQYWGEVCGLYSQALRFLYDNRFMISQKWLPSENMVLPLMMFFRELKIRREELEQEQLEFLKFWFWASVFANRYAGSTNEVMIEDSKILKQISHKNYDISNSYHRKLRPIITDADHVLEFKKRASSIYKGLLNIINFDSDQGLLDWPNTSRLTINQTLHDHHIFPKAFVRDKYPQEVQDLVDTVANRALIPKLTNLKIGAKSPAKYLQELRKKNSRLQESLCSHKIDERILEGEFDDTFEDFVCHRAQAIFEIIECIVKPPENKS